MGVPMSSDTYGGFQGPKDLDGQFLTGTPVGVDLGVKHLLTLAPAAASADVSEGTVIHDSRVEAYFDSLQWRVRAFDDSRTLYQDRVGMILADRLRTLLDQLADEVMAFLEGIDIPIIVLEELSYTGRTLEECVIDGARIECWLFPSLKTRLAVKAGAAGVAVAEVDEEYSTRQCHICKQFTSVQDETVDCPTEDCPVDVVCRDLSAAATLAERVL